jgi:hypothetical protein
MTNDENLPWSFVLPHSGDLRVRRSSFVVRLPSREKPGPTDEVQ